MRVDDCFRYSLRHTALPGCLVDKGQGATPLGTHGPSRMPCGEGAGSRSPGQISVSFTSTVNGFWFTDHGYGSLQLPSPAQVQVPSRHLGVPIQGHPIQGLEPPSTPRKVGRRLLGPPSETSGFRST